MKPEATTIDDANESSRRVGVSSSRLAFVVVWCSEPGRVGEVIPLPGTTPLILGRGAPQPDDPFPRVAPLRQRPGRNERRPPFESPSLSRVQLRFELVTDAHGTGPAREGVLVVNEGRKPLLGPAGEPVSRLVVRPGQVVEITRQLSLVCVRRPEVLPASENGVRLHTFGEPDDTSVVGESAATWALRDTIAFVGARFAHVLVLGESGTGKELCARAIHMRSPRSRQKLVARNAATLPPGLIDAELFGNVANYPNAGMPERPGLVGQADGGTLFLDEIGELTEELQTRLLRVLDERGEYQRLGDAKPRSSDFRLVAATNRSVEALRHDVLARFHLRIALPGLSDRREDVPLVARALLLRIAARDAAIGARFFEGWDGAVGEPRFSPALIRALTQHMYSTHVRELDGLLWSSLSTSTGGTLELTPAVETAIQLEGVKAPQDVSEAEVRAALERAGNVKEKAYRELGLTSRHALRRLMTKWGIAE